MFFGDYHYKISQGRVIIPPGVRSFFQNGVRFEFSESGCVAGFPSIVGSPVDKRGRVTLPAKLRKAARIEDEAIVLAGSEDYLEVWGKENWEREFRQVVAEVEELVRRN